MKKSSYSTHSKLERIYMGKGISKNLKLSKRKIMKTPVKPVDLTKTKSIKDLVSSFQSMSIQARLIGKCASVYENMLIDKRRPTILLGLAGPLIAGGLRKTLRDMIAYGLVDVVVSTGAIIYQDIYQALGHNHYIGSPDADDSILRKLLINRIYDTYVDDEKFVKTDTWVGKFASTLDPRNYSSREFLSLLGKKIKDKNSILKTATDNGIPVFCPAINDSSIGIGLTDNYHLKRKKNSPKITIDAIRDNYELTQIVVKSKCTSAVYVAGGVPKNYINDSVVMSYIFGKVTGGHIYALQVTTDVPHWGGLSGSTLSEAKSWGKISEKATKAMAFVEPTVSLPLIIGYILEKKLWKKRQRLNLKWDGDILKELKLGKKIKI